MAADLVQAIRPFVGRVAGRRILVRAGDLFAGDDATVLAFPERFRAPVVRQAPDPRPEPQPARRRASPARSRKARPASPKK